MAQITDAALARTLLDSALAFGKTDPDITETQMQTLLGRAEVTLEDDSVAYTSASLNAAASLGWQWKAQLASSEYDDLGRIKRPVGLAERWMRYSAAYASGSLDVLGGVAPGTTRHVSSIGMVGELAVEYPL